MRTERVTAAIAAGVVLVACAVAADVALGQRDEERELEAVRDRIGELERRLERQSAERGEAEAALKRVELEIAAARKALGELETRRAVQRQRADELAQQRRAAAERLAGERDALAEQLRITYMNGREELLKLLLSQENPADIGRMTVYYDYFNTARTERVRTVADELDRLARLEAEAEAVAAELAELGEAREAELAELDRARTEREALVAELEAELEAGGGELERLKDEEGRLVALVTELGELLAAFPVDSEEPFPELKGRLPWPVAGEIVGEYGAQRSGGMRWNGMLLAAPRGAPVRAVYHGRVAFADWLSGLGLLVIVDHGDGYMTLYGHNDAVLKEPGDVVRPGEAIAEVGESGGRRQPSLYFEIRHDGEPVDPRAWVAR